MVNRISLSTYCNAAAERLLLPATGTNSYWDVYTSILNMEGARCVA
jgi:hypothetical protein